MNFNGWITVSLYDVRTDNGNKYFPDVDTEIDEVWEDKYIIVGDDPLSAKAVCTRKHKIVYQVSDNVK